MSNNMNELITRPCIIMSPNKSIDSGLNRLLNVWHINLTTFCVLRTNEHWHGGETKLLIFSHNRPANDLTRTIEHR